MACPQVLPKLAKSARAAVVMLMAIVIATRHTLDPWLLLPVMLYGAWFSIELLNEVPPPSGEATRDRGTRQAILATRDGALLAAVWHASNRLPGSDISQLWAAAGTALFAAGLALRLKAIGVLGSNFTMVLTTKASAEFSLVTHGVYGRIRHPGYLALLIMFVSWPVAVGGAIVAAVVLTASLFALGARIAIEERDLSARFGDAYTKYRATVPALLPRVYRKARE